jgi:hypothetical protein
MITPKEAVSIAEKHLKSTDIEYIKLADKVQFSENEPIATGKYKDQFRDVYVVTYLQEGYDDPHAYFMLIDAVTKEVLYTVGRHGYLE